MIHPGILLPPHFTSSFLFFFFFFFIYFVSFFHDYKIDSEQTDVDPTDYAGGTRANMMTNPLTNLINSTNLRRISDESESDGNLASSLPRPNLTTATSAPSLSHSSTRSWSSLFISPNASRAYSNVITYVRIVTHTSTWTSCQTTTPSSRRSTTWTSITQNRITAQQPSKDVF